MRQICSVLAGYVWDKTNPYVAQPERALPLLSRIVNFPQPAVPATEPAPPANVPDPRSKNFFSEDPLTAYDAKSEAQRIAFAPVVFQASRLLREHGILELIQRSGASGLTLDELTATVALPRYGIKVLLESGLGGGLLLVNDGRYTLSKVGYFVLRDPMTRINMDVVHEVCYRGMFELDTALKEGRPAGLKSLGDWKTFYEGLASLPPRTRDAWLAFDHYYSDQAFPAALPLVFADKPKRLLDVGGNTGKWAIQCAKFDPHVRVTIADLPPQLELARANLREQGFEGRVDLFATDLLDPARPLPGGHDAIWMSQFLDCFSEKEIVSILRRAAEAMSADSSLYILELLWDRQPNATAAFCLQQTSLYFACIANGNSQMYHSADLLRCIAASGLRVVEDRDEVGLYHTLLKCRKA
ncbi:MAG: methyltransferase domain-containing protein [Verrucomicrobia bacterium]|nr:methyltransferase domain-containing protein [Verrucomicrobiota bacterium]